VKKFLILSSDQNFKKELLTELQADKKNKIDCTTVTTRPNAISELSQKEFDALLIHCTLDQKDLQIILKYLSTNNYFLCHIFFLSEDFKVFEEILAHLNFPHLNLVNWPINPKDLGQQIINKIYPKDTTQIDKDFKINLDFLKVFIDSTKKVLQDFCALEKVTHDKPYLLTLENTKQYSVLGKIVLNSEIFEGSFSIGFTKEIYLALINKVLMIDALEINEEILDFAAELVNMVYGQAKFTLNDTGYNFQKVIPSFEFNPTNTPKNFHVVVVPLITSLGVINIEVEVRKIKGMKL
jgi:CheY-specific phosphatase CheX